MILAKKIHILHNINKKSTLALADPFLSACPSCEPGVHIPNNIGDVLGECTTGMGSDNQDGLGENQIRRRLQGRQILLLTWLFGGSIFSGTIPFGESGEMKNPRKVLAGGSKSWVKFMAWIATLSSIACYSV